MAGNDFGDTVRRLREERGLSLRQMQAATGVSNAYLSQIELGRVGPPSPKIIERIAEALEYPYVELMSSAGYLEHQREVDYVKLGGQTVPLDGLSLSEREQLLQFIASLRQARQPDRT